ncbi:DUF4435 domain-containing protein, partial [Acetobacter sicerae]
MSFTRSASALHSIHKFFGVDIVVYCEGGDSLSFANAVKHERLNGTLDTFYWRSVAQILDTGKIYHFKSIGGKDTINRIAEEVDRLSLRNISVCRDSDYDRARGIHPNSTRVAWTEGYSWENDVSRIQILEKLAINLMGAGDDCDSVIAKMKRKISEFEKELCKWVEVDVSFISRGRGGFFDREKPLSAIDMTCPPKLRLSALSQKLTSAGYHRKPRKVLSVLKEDVITKCFGKLISKTLYQVFISCIRGFINSKIDYDLFM